MVSIVMVILLYLGIVIARGHLMVIGCNTSM